MSNPGDTYPHWNRSEQEKALFENAQWIVPGIAVVTCVQCGAWVDPQRTAVHANWHSRTEAK